MHGSSAAGGQKILLDYAAAQVLARYGYWICDLAGDRP